MESTTIFQMIGSLQTLPPLDKQNLTPCVTLDAGVLVNTVAQLWDAVRTQRTLFEAMEKENNRRRAEQEVRFSNFQQEVESKVHQEAKKRAQGDEQLSAEIASLRAEWQGALDTVRTGMKNLEGSVSSSLDHTVAQLKLAVLQVQEKTTDLSGSMAELRDGLASANQKIDAIDRKFIDETGTLHGLVSDLFGLWHLTPKDVRGALADSRETELLLAAPPFSDMSKTIRGIDEKSSALRRELGTLSTTVHDNVRRIINLESESLRLKDMPLRLQQLGTELRELLAAEVEKLNRKIASIERSQTVAPDNRQAIITCNPPEVPLEQVSSLESRMSRLEDLLSSKADQSSLLPFALKSDVADIEAAVRAIRAMLDALRAEPPRGAVAPTAPARDLSLSAALISLKDSLDGLTKRVDTIEHDVEALKNHTVTKDELRESTRDVLKAAENAINHIYHELRKMIDGINVAAAAPHVDSTSARFRCLSCNRDAGPLSEVVRERLSREQFPPSSTLLSRDSPPRSASRAVVSGNRDGSVTSSRRKLQNYYDWLQSKEEHPANGRRRSTTPPKTVWLGAQSGGGGSGRQCGDHGSDDPDSIGVDGKYYTAVKSRPQSAASQRPKSAMKLTEEEAL